MSIIIATNAWLQTFVLMRAERTRFVIDRRGEDEENAVERSQIAGIIANNEFMQFASQGNHTLNAGSVKALPNTTYVPQLAMAGLSQDMGQAFPISQPNAQVFPHGNQQITTQAYQLPLWSQGYTSGVASIHGNGFYNSNSQGMNENEEKESESSLS